MEINEQELHGLISDPYFSRGRAYFKDRMVGFLVIEVEQVQARVVGSQIYNTQFKRIGKKLTGVCSCPAFQDHGPCKHLAATGLALMQHYKGGYKPSEDYEMQTEFLELVERYIKKRTREELIDLIFQLVCNDPNLRYMFEEYEEEYEGNRPTLFFDSSKE